MHSRLAIIIISTVEMDMIGICQCYVPWDAAGTCVSLELEDILDMVDLNCCDY